MRWRRAHQPCRRSRVDPLLCAPRSCAPPLRDLARAAQELDAVTRTESVASISEVTAKRFKKPAPSGGSPAGAVPALQASGCDAPRRTHAHPGWAPPRAGGGFCPLRNPGAAPFCGGVADCAPFSICTPHLQGSDASQARAHQRRGCAPPLRREARAGAQSVHGGARSAEAHAPPLRAAVPISPRSRFESSPRTSCAAALSLSDNAHRRTATSQSPRSLSRRRRRTAARGRSSQFTMGTTGPRRRTLQRRGCMLCLGHRCRCGP